MTELSSIIIMGVRVHPWTMEQTVEEITRRLNSHEFTQHVVVNVAKLVNMHKDKSLKESVTSSDIINIDGMGVVWGGRFLGKDIPERVAGIDLFYQLLAMSSREGFSIYLLGAEESVVSITAEKIKLLYPDINIAGFHDGYFWDDEAAMVDKIRKSGAQMLFVAISSPKKENFINKWQSQLGVNFVMGVGGTFDVVAGKVKRAPVWMQKMGLEWLFRVLQEPRRMWKRYFVTNSLFLWYLLKEKARNN